MRPASREAPPGEELPADVDEPYPPSRVWLHVLLFALTFFSTTAAGALVANKESIFPLTTGLSFSLPLMAILTCHELGHYVAARLHGVHASLPFFIPLPPQIGLFGTMGAVISQEGTTDRRKLMDIGAAGPLAGLLVALPVLYYGISQSEVTVLKGIGMQEGNSVLYAALKYVVKGAWLPGEGRDVFLHPTAWAGWAGLLITMINLLPIGQLDGGHIATAYFGNRYRRMSRVVHQVLPWLALGSFAWVYHRAQVESGGRPLPGGYTPLIIAIGAALPWFAWFLMILVLGRLSRGLDHPLVDDATPLPRSRRVVFWVVLVTFVLIFMPVPIRYGIGLLPALEGGVAR
jgi:membrane-associated protease RseP (regulator of RpoE activity)